MPSPWDYPDFQHHDLDYNGLGYDGAVSGAITSVQPSIPASLARFGRLLLPFVFLSCAFAQINGTPPSVTSPGFGGRTINGTPPSVTSLGRNGYAPNVRGNFPPPMSRNGSHRHHRTITGNAYYPYIYAVPVPYALDMEDAGTNETDSDADYQGGPTIFDRRGSGRDSYISPSYPGPAHARHALKTESQADDADAGKSDSLVPEPPQPPTTLVFKDGHQVEVGNYAIVSQTLYDLAPGHPRKIALADLDLLATQKQNDERGVTFQLPPSTQAN